MEKGVYSRNGLIGTLLNGKDELARYANETPFNSDLELEEGRFRLKCHDVDGVLVLTAHYHLEGVVDADVLNALFRTQVGWRVFGDDGINLYDPTKKRMDGLEKLAPALEKNLSDWRHELKEYAPLVDSLDFFKIQRKHYLEETMRKSLVGRGEALVELVRPVGY